MWKAHLACGLLGPTNHELVRQHNHFCGIGASKCKRQVKLRVHRLDITTSLLVKVSRKGKRWMKGHHFLLRDVSRSHKQKFPPLQKPGKDPLSFQPDHWNWIPCLNPEWNFYFKFTMCKKKENGPQSVFLGAPPLTYRFWYMDNSSHPHWLRSQESLRVRGI